MILGEYLQFKRCTLQG